MDAARKNHPIATFSAWFLVVFLVLFPKGGIKISSFPITWGYFFLYVGAPILLVVRLTLLPLRMPVRLLAAIAAVIPFQLLYLYAYLMYGVVEWPPAVGLVIGLYFLPFIFLFIFPPFLRFIDGVRLSRYFRWSILLAAMWGLLLFFTRPIIGHFIQIPYFTVNAGDYGALETTKHISRGAYYKLISTYNNGNLYGVATLILLPMYQVLERVRWRRWTVIAALLLTLARTVWAGLIIAEALPLLVIVFRQAETFPVIYLGKTAKSMVALIVTGGLILVALTFNSSASLDFLLDPTAGGRTSRLQSFSHLTLLPTHGVRGFDEVVYVTAAETLGLTGFAAFVLVMISPLLLLGLDRRALKSPIRRAALHGLMIYAVVAWSDGAIILIPVMAFYWFTYLMFLFGWPDEELALARKVHSPLGYGPKGISRPTLQPVDSTSAAT